MIVIRRGTREATPRFLVRPANMIEARATSSADDCSSALSGNASRLTSWRIFTRHSSTDATFSDRCLTAQTALAA